MSEGKVKMLFLVRFAIYEKFVERTEKELSKYVDVIHHSRTKNA